MRKLVFSIVVDILRHVPIQDLKCSRVRRTPTSPWNLTVLDSSEFVVLYPQIGFEYLRRGQKPENCRVSFCELSALFVLFVSDRNSAGKQPSSSHCRHTCRGDSVFQKQTSIRRFSNRIFKIAHRLSPFLQVFCKYDSTDGITVHSLLSTP